MCFNTSGSVSFIKDVASALDIDPVVLLKAITIGGGSEKELYRKMLAAKKHSQDDVAATQLFYSTALPIIVEGLKDLDECFHRPLINRLQTWHHILVSVSNSEARPKDIVVQITNEIQEAAE